MKKLLITASLVAMMGSNAVAQEIGATFSRFDDNWLTVLRNGMLSMQRQLMVFHINKKTLATILQSKSTK